ncbi:MAG: AraC family transcriptional regulator [Halioglobus sp.]
MSASSIPKHSILGTLILPMAEILRQRGIEPEEVIRGVGIAPSDLANPEYRVSLKEFNELMRQCVELTGDEAIGLYCAEAMQPQVLHGLGLGWLASDTVYDGLRRLVRFSKLISSVSELHLEEQGDLVHLHLQRIMEPENYVFAGRDYGLSMVARMCSLNLGQYLTPVRIEIERPAPVEPARWESMLGAHVTFESDRTCMSWYRSDIEHQIVTGDPALARVNDEQAEALIRSFTDDSLSRLVVEKIIRRLPDGPPGQDLIAGDLFMSNRTLQRKLKEEGVNFSELLQDCRMQLAKKYLLQGNKSVVETSYTLGFAEPSAFSRAFKRWTGQSPAQYRDAVA